LIKTRLRQQSNHNEEHNFRLRIASPIIWYRNVIRICWTVCLSLLFYTTKNFNSFKVLKEWLFLHYYYFRLIPFFQFLQSDDLVLNLTLSNSFLPLQNNFKCCTFVSFYIFFANCYWDLRGYPAYPLEETLTSPISQGTGSFRIVALKKFLFVKMFVLFFSLKSWKVKQNDLASHNLMSQ
jgi:hypothetical protein